MTGFHGSKFERYMVIDLFTTIILNMGLGCANDRECPKKAFKVLCFTWATRSPNTHKRGSSRGDSATPSQGKEGSVKAEGVPPVMQWKGGIVAYADDTDRILIYEVNVALWIARQAITRLIHGSMVDSRSELSKILSQILKNQKYCSAVVTVTE